MISGLTKNYYMHQFQHAKNQLSSLLHSWVHNHPEIIKVVLNFREFTSVCKKSTQFIHSFIYSPCDQCATTISDHAHPNIFLSTLNFWYQNVKKYRLFFHFVLDIYLIWNPWIWLANTNLALYEWETTNRFADFTFG